MQSGPELSLRKAATSKRCHKPDCPSVVAHRDRLARFGTDLLAKKYDIGSRDRLKSAHQHNVQASLDDQYRQGHGPCDTTAVGLS